MLEWLDKVAFCVAIFLVVVGLIFGASGFGIIVVGRLDGVILIVMGLTMFWSGWVISGAKGFSSATAAILNMFDAASTISFWNFEINPLVRAAGPTIFLSAKVVCSITIVLYAKLHPKPSKGSIMLALFFGLIVGWNLGQHILAYMGVRIVSYEVFVYAILAALSLAVSAVTLALLFLRKKNNNMVQKTID